MGSSAAVDHESSYAEGERRLRGQGGSEADGGEYGRLRAAELLEGDANENRASPRSVGGDWHARPSLRRSHRVQLTAEQRRRWLFAYVLPCRPLDVRMEQ